MKFCARCGRKGETREGLCEKCYLDAHPTIKAAEEIKIRVCRGCGRAFHRNKWSMYKSTEEMIKSLVKESLKIKEKAEIVPIIKEDAIEAELKFYDSGEKYIIPVNIEEITCKKCGKDTGKYFEGVLQLRDVTKEIIDFVLKDINENQTEGVFIQEAKEIKNGLDLKMTSYKYIRAIGKKLKKRFGGTLKTTAKLFSRNRQTSREVYRIAVLYKGRV